MLWFICLCIDQVLLYFLWNTIVCYQLSFLYFYIHLYQLVLTSTASNTNIWSFGIRIRHAGLSATSNVSPSTSVFNSAEGGWLELLDGSTIKFMSHVRRCCLRPNHDVFSVLTSYFCYGNRHCFTTQAPYAPINTLALKSDLS